MTILPALRGLALAGLLAGAATLPAIGVRAEGPFHALSLVGTPKFGPKFEQFDWVDPEAPKGGRLHLHAIGTFDTLNPFALKGSPAVWLGILCDALMTPSLDEASTEYALIAESVSYPADVSSATFKLRPEARFHDGTPITATDVVFSLDALKKASPRYQIYYKNVVAAEANGPHEVTFRFDAKGNRELPLVVGTMPVLPKHYWQGKDAAGVPRDLAKSTMEIPLGSGPYRVKSVDAGRSITYERVADWWARDLPVTRGQWNHDEVRFDYYRDRVPAFEAFKAGHIDFWAEASAKAWATGYEFDAVKRQLVKREEWPTSQLAPMQGFAFNLRKWALQDPRVRWAFNLAFDFEWASKNILFEQYKRVSSYFENSELKATGMPEGRELKILEEVRGLLPPEVFAKPFANPFNAGPDDARRHMREAARLLADAGWKQKGGVLTNAAGEPLAVEFLLVQPDFERIVHPYKSALEKLGIKATVRIVDSAQYRRRLDTFDFDIIVTSFRQSLSPGNEQREFWGSQAADKEGSRNLIGIKSPAIDHIVERIVFAPDRATLVAASRALDRVLLWSHFLVPQWYAPAERVAMWDQFARPARMPTYASATTRFLQVSWHDKAAAARLATARGR